MRTEALGGVVAVCSLLLTGCHGQFGFRPGGGGMVVPTRINIEDAIAINEDAAPPPEKGTDPDAPSQLSYFVTFPSTLRAGTPHRVSVRLLNPGNVSTVSVSLRNGLDASIVFLETPPRTITADGRAHIFSLEIPHNLTQLSWPDRYHVHVLGSGDVNFNESRRVTLDPNTFALFLQTDKAAYKPGDTVKFRVLAMFFNRTVMREAMDIEIRDKAGNAIKQWRNLEGLHNTGVIENSFPLSKFAATGNWVIKATVMGYTERKIFEVKKYVLPTFEAMVDVPKVVPSSESALRGKAMAKYTFGKPLTDARVRVVVESSGYFNNMHGNRTKPQLTYSGTLDSNGEMPFEFHQEELLDMMWQHDQPYSRDRQTMKLSWRGVTVLVHIVDVRTGRTMTAQAGVEFSDRKASIRFLPNSQKNFKPGLKFSAHVEVTKSDDTLFENYNDINVTFNVTYNQPMATTTTTSTTTTSLDPKENQTVTGRKLQPPVLVEDTRRPWFGPQDTVVLTTFTRTLTADGLLSVQLELPSNASSVVLTVSALGESQDLFVSRAVSYSDNYLQIQQRTPHPKTGQTVSFDLRTTEAVENITYQLHSKGVMLTESTALAVDSDHQLFNLTFPLTANMAPNCRVLAYYIRPDGEVVADSISFKIDTSAEHQVSVSYSPQEVQPGQHVQLVVSARPHSLVFLLAVDKSVTLLKAGNDITSDMVEERLAMLDHWSSGGLWRTMVLCGWPLAFGGVDSSQVFRQASVIVVSDGADFMPNSPFGRNEIDGGMMLSKSAPDSNVRTFFPETWLFSVLPVGDDGQAVVQQTAPHTITTWLTSAFAVHPDYGLSVMDQPAELTTFKKVFVSLDLPYSAIRGEDLCMKALAYNYHHTPLYMRLVMGRSKGVSNIRLIRTSRYSPRRVEYRAPMRVSHRIGKVKANEIGETMFCFTPSALGHLPITVNLTTSLAGDAVQRMLLVEPEGVPRTQNFPVILDVNDNSEFSQVVPLTFPPEAVNGSQRIRVSLAGHVLGPVLGNN